MKIERDGDLLDTGEPKMMTDEEFEREVQMAADGRWAELDLDPLPSDFTPATMDDLINAE